MSKISLKSSSSGTATFTIESPATNTDRTLVLPDVAGTVATAESTLAQFNVTGSAPVFACRAFVNFNGTGTVAIRASGNVSSITDNGTGDYTVNFTTAMPDANYASAFSAINISAGINTLSVGSQDNVTPRTTTAVRLVCKRSNGSLEDNSHVSCVIFR